MGRHANRSKNFDSLTNEFISIMIMITTTSYIRLFKNQGIMSVGLDFGNIYQLMPMFILIRCDNMSKNSWRGKFLLHFLVTLLYPY